MFFARSGFSYSAMQTKRGTMGIAGGRMAVLELLKRQGPIASEALAAQLGITAMAVRQHLSALEDDGLARSEARPNGRGRPAKHWSATLEADSRFPDSHSALAVELIQHLRTSFGDEGLDRLLRLRTAEQQKSYGARIGAKHSLKDRLKALARIRAEEGYMAEVRRDGDGWLFVENHCPICAAAKLCSGLCREELALFQRVLGNGVRVERVSHIVAGAGRCAYRVRAAGNGL